MKTIANNMETTREVVREADFVFYVLGDLGLKINMVSENFKSKIDFVSLLKYIYD